VGRSGEGVRFRDRSDAGRQLAHRLDGYRGRDDVIVMALPRGGVPIGFEVAHELGVPLDVVVVRKLGVPGRKELAFGAIAQGGARVLNRSVVEMVGLSAPQVDEIASTEQRVLDERAAAYRGSRPLPPVEGMTVIVVDDGLATGATMRAALSALRLRRPTALVVAVPVASAETCEQMRAVADDAVCVATPAQFQAVSLWYDDFSQTTDDEVRSLLARAAGG
jgi:predicted phosphoribosyltransferase